MTRASGFDLLPAIDLRGGRVVRLQQGDFARETAFPDHPIAVAREFVDAGARWLHVVDLDGARSGAPPHGAVVAAIIGAVGRRASVEVAGGLRDHAAVAAALASGAARVVVGTAALRDPSFAGRLVVTHGTDRIAVAIDVRDGQAVGHGWSTDAAGIDAADAMVALAAVGVATFEVTAVDRDGMLGGPDLALYERLVALECGSIIASGGIASLAHMHALRDAGCTGAIVGRAIYDGGLDLRKGISAFN